MVLTRISQQYTIYGLQLPQILHALAVRMLTINPIYHASPPSNIYIITHAVIVLQCAKLTSCRVYRLLRFVTGIVAFIIVQLGVVTA